MVLAFLSAAVITYLLLPESGGGGEVHTLGPPTVSAELDEDCGYDIRRMTGFKEVGPLISAEPQCEAKRFEQLKQRLTNMLNEATLRGELTDVSIHVQDLVTSEWMIINDSSRFSPVGSMRVPLMIAYFQMEEHEPGTLARRMRYEGGIRLVPRLMHSLPSTITIGGEYAIGDLIRMAVRDNDHIATSMLIANADQADLGRIYHQIGVSPNCLDTVVDRLGVRDYSLFWKALVHGSALILPHCEQALELLSRSLFLDGISAGLPSGTMMVSRYGETVRPSGAQLRETGIIYVGGTTYLVTVMTKGPRLEPLPAIHKQASALVYTEMIPPRVKPDA
jgi:hypothetical protein